MVLEFLIAFLGLIAGFFLNKVVKEELEPGKKYFAYLSIALLVCIIISSIAPIWDIFIGILIGIILSYLITKVYFYFGISALASILSNKSIILLSGLIFVFGLSYAALDYKGVNKKFLLKSLIFFFIPFLLLLVNIFPGFYTIFSGISIGGLIMSIIKIKKATCSLRF